MDQEEDVVAVVSAETVLAVVAAIKQLKLLYIIAHHMSYMAICTKYNQFKLLI